MNMSLHMLKYIMRWGFKCKEQEGQPGEQTTDLKSIGNMPYMKPSWKNHPVIR